MTKQSDWASHHLVMIAIAAAGVVACALFLRWDWVPAYGGAIAAGVWRTIWLLVLSTVLGFALAIPIGLVQVTGPAWLALPARGFCTLIRGTPLLVQLWLLYYGLGSLFPQFPWIRESFLWPVLRQAWPYGLLALTLSYAGYEAEVMRGAFAGVPRGQLEAARAYGMPPVTLFRRVWLPLAIFRALPTLAGETVQQLKATPLVATITVFDIFAVASRVRQDTYITYEPLLLVAVVYMILSGLIALAFRALESRLPVRVG